MLADALVALEVVDSISDETVRRTMKNGLKPWRKKMWCIPPNQNAAFVAAMEQVLQVYARPYDLRHPVVCMDEQPKQLIRETREPITTAHGEQRVDHEYIREGICNVWMFVEPLGGWRSVRVSDRRTAVDWAQQVKALVDDPRYAHVHRSPWCATTSTPTSSPRYTWHSIPKKPCGSPTGSS